MYVVSMYVSVCKHTILLYAFVCLIISKYAHTYKCYLVYHLANLESLAFMYVYMYVNMYACMYLRMCEYTYLNMYV